MKLETWQRDRNERCMERHQLSIERLQMIDQEETVQDRYRPYFRMCAAFLLKLESLRRTIEDHSFETFTLEERKRWNQELYVDILGENYKKSFADPTYAVKMLSEVYGQLLSFLYTELRSGIPYAFSNRLDYLTILNELFLEIYQCFEAQEQPVADLHARHPERLPDPRRARGHHHRAPAGAAGAGPCDLVRARHCGRRSLCDLPAG